MTGLMPILVLCAILGMAAKCGFDVVDFFTTVEQRDARNYVVVTKVFGLPVHSRPATPSDLNKEEAIDTTMKVTLLGGSFLILGGSLLMCFSALTKRPRKALLWFDRKLGSAQLFQGRAR